MTGGQAFWLQKNLQFAQQPVGKGYRPGQLLFGRDMILPIKNRVNWELIHHKYQTQINRDNAHENKHKHDYDHKVRDKVMVTKQTS